MRFVPEQYTSTVESFQYKVLQLGAVYAFSLFAALLLARLIARSCEGAGLTASARSVVWGVTAFLLSWPVVTAAGQGFVAIQTKQTGSAPPNIAHPALKELLEQRSSPYAWAMIFLLVVAAPIIEEIIYRGFVQSAFLRLTGWPWISAILSSAVFAGVHMLPGNPLPWYSAATVGVLGLCMAIAYERTKEIGVPITMHVLFNAVNVALAYATVK